MSRHLSLAERAGARIGRRGRSRGRIENLLLDFRTTAWLGRGILRMRRGRLPWQRSTLWR